MEGSKSRSAQMQGYAWAEGEERKRRRHMLPVSTLGMNTVASDSTTSSASVCQDGRKINVGDSTLFKPLQWQDSPPFIDMIIRDHPNACFGQQEEVDQLLDRTRLEMHAAIESGGHSSSKPLNGPTLTSTLLESEIAKITDKGGLVDFDAVEKFLQLMQPGRTEKKIDMAGRMMLADVIASTNSFDCLGHFVQHMGLSVLDEWLQEVHKGKIGDGGSPNEGDKSIEEFLLALLRALDKLPVNLHALQTCNVGNSVNHLCSHKNLEIQKMARSLVDTWKKREEAEFKIIEAKPGSGNAVSWPSKQGFSQVSCGGSINTVGSSTFQDGRKIIGDSTLFKPLQCLDSPPFIDMIIQEHPNACFGQQEEVDQLLDKTRLEMHAAIESGGHSSSKPLNGPTLTSTPPIKNMLESEIAKITDKGGLVDFVAVEKFVQLMQPNRTEKKIDMAGRMMLANVIASTNSFDCLSHFVQHMGLSVLDEWLQEVHKGKIGDGGSPNEGDKSIEEFLLALLRALDKMPVNLRALQTCTVGVSLNHLRNHKNLEIQKMVRSLVNAWKKRVAAEFKIIEAKSGSGHAVSWPSKQGFSQVSCGGRINTVESSMFQDGRKIIGDSTLFKPLQCQDSPPFIDMIIQEHPNACFGQQEEVDQLLDKTRLEMHAAIESGGHSSSKPLNGPTLTSTPPIKNMLESEIAKITDKGGLVDFVAVEKFVQLMQPNRTEKKIDMAGRMMLANVIASTNSFDCLGHFVQHMGLSVLDEWLQEVHKGKIGDGGSPNEGDKSIEEFLLALLRALDKMPVNLRALQTCTVGVSLSHLCNHKNLEIQKMVRSLVNAWKKRVAAEFKINEAKSGSGHAVSWPSKQGFSQVSCGGRINTVGSSMFQDGRKIIGDSTLFKPLQWQDSPPFFDMIIREHPHACFGQQEEVDQLLDKTRLEMHAAIESRGCSSSKPLNGSTLTSTPPIKNMLEFEIAKITDKGGLVDFDTVEKFVQLMQPGRTEKKIDMVGRSMLADVIASTNSFDCLGHFVQHMGLSVLDEWLQEVHKGKIGDGGSPNEGDKSIEEFLLALLRALDKLPVNLRALQTWNIGNSVNHLCSHKNLEIQKMARSLVDTWKKREEAEFKIIEAKSGYGHAVSWPSKQGFSQVFYGGSINTLGSSRFGPAVSGSVQDSN